MQRVGDTTGWVHGAVLVTGNAGGSPLHHGVGQVGVAELGKGVIADRQHPAGQVLREPMVKFHASYRLVAGDPGSLQRRKMPLVTARWERSAPGSRRSSRRRNQLGARISLPDAVRRLRSATT